MILIDTNILARYLLDDIPDHSVRIRALFKKAGAGEEELFVPATAVAELMWLLIRKKRYPKEIVTGLLLDLFQITSVIVENKEAVISALRMYVNSAGLSYVDCYHLALAERPCMNQIYSFDKRMSRYLGVERIEPELPVNDA